MISDKEHTQVDKFRLLCKTLRERSTLDFLVGFDTSTGSVHRIAQPTVAVYLLTGIT
ncbi:hypothetical protein [Nostoc sp. TCL240-02]|uniref:hypothetical protein n=1 Tax=Nostoc sp. TCL240-02 TaxID=2572090 RepID=UPI00157FB47F|nr:hypothetical protein [Nostoc sp. TCL240-02]